MKLCDVLDRMIHDMERTRNSLTCRLGLATLLSAGLSATAWGQTDELATAIQEKLDSVGIMGFAASVMVDQEVVWQRGFGYSDWRRTQPFTVDTMTGVASVSKPFIGVAMMQAVEAGKLDLDADINHYLPFKVVNPHHPAEKITLRHLATHTSGISDRWEVYRKSYIFDGDPKQSLEEYLRDYLVPGSKEYSTENFLEAKPGASREYSNIASSLAAYIVEQVEGQSLDVITRDRIFRPLKMDRSAWFLRDLNRAHLSAPFISQNGHVVPLQPYGSVTYPDGGLRSSVSDLTRFFRMMLMDGSGDGVRILRTESAKEMQRFQFGEGKRPLNYPESEGNSGLFWRTKMNGTRIGHGGNDPGVAVEMMASLDRSIAIVFASNTSLGGEDSAVFGELIDLLWKYGQAKKQRSESLHSWSDANLSSSSR